MTALVVFALAAFCQTPPAPHAFEVASIKASAPFTGGRIRMGISQDPGRVTISALSLKTLLAQAYKVKEQLLVTPDWMETARFDVVAKMPEGATKDQIPEMLQTLLAERFKMTIHKEKKVLPIYALVVAKGGPKLKDADAAGGLSMMMSPAGLQMTGKAPLERLAGALSNTLDRPVIDMTELTGVYEIDLTWTPDESDRLGEKMAARTGGPARGPEGGGESKASGAPDAPNLFVALQETMGLKLEPRKALSEVIVVDHAGKTPTEN